MVNKAKIIYASTSGIYGHNAIEKSVTEDIMVDPRTSYAMAKRYNELYLAALHEEKGLDCIALRYFNAAGADPEGEIGESHSPETHLIPNVLQNALGQSGGLQVYGNDYATRDGTCVRDYVHVADLAEAHLLALRYLGAHTGAHQLNLGSGAGYSVMEIIETARQVTGCSIEYVLAPRRAGDPPTLVADATRAIQMLGWQPRFDDVRSIIETAWRWHRMPLY